MPANVARRRITIFPEDVAATSSSGQPFQYTPLVRGLNTTIAVFSILLVVYTYFVLLKQSTHLFRGINVPTETLAANIELLLGDLWPERHRPGKSQPADNGRRPSKGLHPAAYVVLVYSANSLDDIDEWTTSYPHDPGRLDKEKRGKIKQYERRGLRPEGFRDVVQRDPPSDNPKPEDSKLPRGTHFFRRKTIRVHERRGGRLKGILDKFKRGPPPDVTAPDDPKPDKPKRSRGTYFFRASSPALRSAVQLAIWEWVSLLLAAAMLVSTLSYNGFLTGDSTPDGGLRLGLAVAYAAANAAHFAFAWPRFLQTYSKAVEHAGWSVVCRARFLFTDGKSYRKLMNSRPMIDDDYNVPFRAFDVDVLGKIKLLKRFERLYSHRGRFVYEDHAGRAAAFLSTYGTEPVLDIAYLKHATTPKKVGREEEEEQNREVAWEREQEEVDGTFRDVDDQYKAEIAVLEKATESALERVTANVAIVFGVCLATGLAPWTSTVLSDPTSTQLGSYAMLLSVSSGLAALLTSSSHLNNMLSAAAKVVDLTEAVLLRPADRFNRDLEKAPASDSLRRHAVTPAALWRAMGLAQRLLSTLFGPMLVLLGKSAEAPSSLYLRVKLGDKTLWFTTDDDGYRIFRERRRASTSGSDGRNKANEPGSKESQSDGEDRFPSLPSDGVHPPKWLRDDGGGEEWRQIREGKFDSERETGYTGESSKTR